jgi:hypothetical protein
MGGVCINCLKFLLLPSLLTTAIPPTTAILPTTASPSTTAILPSTSILPTTASPSITASLPEVNGNNNYKKGRQNFDIRYGLWRDYRCKGNLSIRVDMATDLLFTEYIDSGEWETYMLMEGVAQCRIDGGNTRYIC